MTETDARTVLLLRALETSPDAAGVAAVWSAADAVWASAEASRRLGPWPPAEAFVVERARLGLARLAEQHADWRGHIHSDAHAMRWVAGMGLGAAFVVGLASDALSPSQRINLLALPLLGLLVWNLVVYAALAWSGVRRAAAGHLGARRPHPPGRVVRLGLAAAQWLALRVAGGRGAIGALHARFAADWQLVMLRLQARRGVAWLHAAAALLAVGAVASMYARALVLDYRAGWDSTLLGPAQVSGLLQVVLGPAAALTGWGLPDATTLAGLRWADGSPGDHAARWIHLYALTVFAVVVLPRTVLAIKAWLRARRAALNVKLPLAGPYYDALLSQLPTTAPVAACPVTVLCYSFKPTAEQRAGLAAALADLYGPTVQPLLAEPLPLGAEDSLPDSLPDEMADHVALLFSLAATPERETHGALVRALMALLPPGCALQLLVDLSGYRQRLATLPEAEERLQQRRGAWLRLMADLALPTPRFIDLAPQPRMAEATA